MTFHVKPGAPTGAAWRVAATARRLGIAKPAVRAPVTGRSGSGQGSPFEQGHAAGWEEGHAEGWRDGYAAGVAEAEGRMCGGCR